MGKGYNKNSFKRHTTGLGNEKTAYITKIYNKPERITDNKNLITMCGRFERKIDNDDLIKEFEKHIGKLDIAYDLPEEDFKTENIAPTNSVKAIVFDPKDNVFKLKTFKWGIKSKVFDPLRQAKGKDPFIEKDIFNSKIETISKKGSKWMKFMKESRCIIPMTAFYEWTGEKSKKIPQRINVQRDKVFYAGGIVAEGTDKKESASIITCEPNKFMKTIHNRMPAIFQANNAGVFLTGNEDAAIALCAPLDNGIKMSAEKAAI
jgi:putative SOS response-associated peptidase YedK